MNNEELEQVAITAARVGGAHVVPAVGQARAVATKSSPTDVVTETDLASEQAILTYLTQQTPDAALLAEEGGTHLRTTTTEGSRLEWIIDPLDGTINFIYGLAPVAVSVAAAVDGQIVAGAVFDTSTGQVFSAAKGSGARCNGEPIAVSGCTELDQAMLGTGYAYDAKRRARHGRSIARLLAHVRDVRCFGSSALHLCWLASGHIDAYIERHNQPWDWAAGILIAAEAGATVELPCSENDDLVMATTPELFEPLRHLVLIETERTDSSE